MKNKIITKDEVVNLVFNRNVDGNILKPSMVDLAQFKYLQKYLGDLYNDILDSEDDDYNDFVEDYVKPVIAWAVLYENFDYISLNITDKGILQMVVEGTANLIGRDSRYDFKMELRRNLFTLIQLMQNEVLKEKNNNNDLYKNYNSKFKPSMIHFVEGNQRYNIRPY